MRINPAWLRHINKLSTTLWFISLCLLYIGPLNAQRTDVVILKNGDRLTGDVKSLEYAKLRLKTDAMDNVYINWEDIVYIKSDDNFRVEMQDGRLLFGIVHTDTSNNMLIVGIDTLKGTVAPDRVVGIVPIKEGFWQIVDISTEMGFNYTKSSDIAQLNFSGNISYRTFTYLRRFRFSSILSAEKDDKANQTHNYSFSVSKLLRKNWFIDWAASADKNTGLDLDLRLSLGMSGGRKIFHTNLHDLSTSLGLQGTKEWAISKKGQDNNLEGVASLVYRRFRYYTPKQDVEVRFDIFPNITTWGRYRIDFETKFKWEIITDLFISLTYKNNFDNQAGTDGTTKNDYSLIISFGWTK